MSTELTTFDAENEEHVAAYLDKITNGEDQQLAELGLETNPFDVMPKLVLNDRTKEITFVLGDKTVMRFDEDEPLYFLCILMAERRALWRPDSMKRTGTADEEKDRLPICSTSNLPIGTFRREDDRGVGTWRLKDNEDLIEWTGLDSTENEPDTILRNCRSCPLNEYKSAADFGGEGKGKACGEGRLLVGYVVTKMGEVRGHKMFGFAPNAQMVFAQLSASSIKTVKAMGTACVARKVPARYSVFQLGNEPRSEGQMRWGVLTQNLVGFIRPQQVEEADSAWKSTRDMVIVDNVAPRYPDEDAPVPRGQEQVMTENGEEVPF